MTDHWDGSAFIGTKLLLTHGDALLTHLRDDFDHIPFPGYWDLPGGGREPGEAPMACGLRELDEEYGLRLAPDRLDPRCFPSEQYPGQTAWMLTGAITAAEIAAIRFGDEGQEWRLMPVADYLAHPRAVPHFQRRIALILGLSGPASAGSAAPHRP